MKRTTIPLKDGWYRMPDRSGNIAPFGVEDQNSRNCWWAQIRGQIPVAVANLDEQHDFPQDYQATQPQQLLCQVWRRETGATVFDHMRRLFDVPECKHNGLLLPFEIADERIAFGCHLDQNASYYEDLAVAEVLEKLKSQMRRGMRAFPVCSWGGKIDVFGKINRRTRSVQAGFACDCHC